MFSPFSSTTWGDADSKIDSPFDALMAGGFDALLGVAGEWREIVTYDKNGNPYARKCKVIWSEEALRDKAFPHAEGGVYYLGDILLTIKGVDLKGIPTPNSVLESPKGVIYQINEVKEDYGTFALSLVKST